MLVDQLRDPDERPGRQPGVGVEEYQRPAARQPCPEVPRPRRAPGSAGRHQHATVGGMPGQGVGRAVVARVVDHDDLNRRAVAASFAVAIARRRTDPTVDAISAASFLAGMTTEIRGVGRFMGVASPVGMWRPRGRDPGAGLPGRTGHG